MACLRGRKIKTQRRSAVRKWLDHFQQLRRIWLDLRGKRHLLAGGNHIFMEVPARRLAVAAALAIKRHGLRAADLGFFDHREVNKIGQLAELSHFLIAGQLLVKKSLLGKPITNKP